MSKRLVRIGSGNIYQALSGLVGHEINTVQENGKTYFGRLLSFTSEKLLLNDTRSHSHDIRLDDLYEIVYDNAQEKTIK